MRLRPIVRRVVPAVLLVTLTTGCPKHKPLTVDQIDERLPQRPAAIVLSDPQIYWRETLVNDRRREAAYLQKLIAASESIVFEPQIRRDLRLLTSTVLQLEAAFDPLAGRQAARGEELAEIDQQIAETERLQKLADARLKLVEAERRLEEVIEQEENGRSAARAADTRDAGVGGAGDNGSGGTPETPEDPAMNGTDVGNAEEKDEKPTEEKKLEALRADLAKIKELIALLPSTVEVRRTAVQSTPRELFRDRQAYRDELRGALGEVELDDAHDQGQNSLYRLQFRATVSPGEHKAKMGVARLTLLPPELTEEDVLELYKIWLGHVTYRLNQSVGTSFLPDNSYLLLGMGLQNALFHATSYCLTGGGAGTSKCGRDEVKLRVALPPEAYAEWKAVTQGEADDWEIVNGKMERLLGFVHALEQGRRAVPVLDADCAPCRDADWIDHWDLLRRLSRVEPFMSASIRGIADRSSLEPEIDRQVHMLIDAVGNGSEALDRLRLQLIRRNPHCRANLTAAADPDAQLATIPEPFVKAVVRDFNDGRARPPRRDLASSKAIGIGRGGADVYVTSPIELAQQISTTASAVRSFETALALAASLPTQGVGAEAGLNHLRASRSDLEAIERLPQVVGFAERTPWRKDPGSQNGFWPDGEDPQFGWIFGPQATIDAKENRLRLGRPVTNYPVTADLSIPGWWPKIELELETAWVGNWWDGELLQQNDGHAPPVSKVSRFPVYLPLNRADLDGLTEFLAKRTVGGALAYTSIAAVSPEKISTCADELTFLVYGSNVWRSSTAFLNGLEASEVRVLPDMAGLAVKFTGIRKALPQVPGAGGEATLTVWTRNGASSKKVVVLDPKASGISCVATEEVGLKLAVGPRPLVPAAGSTLAPAALRVVGGKLPTSFERLGISVRPSEPMGNGRMHAWSGVPTETAVARGLSIEGNAAIAGLDLKAGQTLHASLVERPAPGAEEIRHPVDGMFVFYPTAEQSLIRPKKARLESVEPIVLVLPYRYDVAYPDLRDGKVEFGLRVEPPADGLVVALAELKPAKLPPAAAVADAERELKLPLVVTRDGTAVTDPREIAKLLATDRALVLTLEGGDALPKVSSAVTLGKAKKPTS